MALSIGDRVRVLQLEDDWASLPKRELPGRTGTIERLRDADHAERCGDAQALFLVAFDEPLRHMTGAWFTSAELELLGAEVPRQ